MVVVRSCCCGCNLAQGTIGTGIVSLVEAILYIVVGAYFFNLRFNPDDDSEFREHKDVVNSYFYVVGIFALVQGSLILLVTIFLLCAVQTKRRFLLLPWLIVRGILLGLGILGCIILFAGGQNFLVSIINILWMGLMIYLYLVVVSYYQSDMERIVNQGQVLSPAPTTAFVPIPQQPDVQYKPPYAMSTVPPAGTNVYYPPQNTNLNHAVPIQYPTQSYSYAPPSYAGGQPQSEFTATATQPPPYPGPNYSEHPEKSGNLQHY